MIRYPSGSTSLGDPLHPLAPLRLPPAPSCIGIDLAGLPTNPSGFAVLREGRLKLLGMMASDDEIVALIREHGRGTLVAVNAPLGLPAGRCCLDDDCRCRHDLGTRSHAVERQLARERVPTLATAVLKILARRGIALAARLRTEGFQVLEAYPYATLRLLDLPARGKRRRTGRATMLAALAPLVPGLTHREVTEHELDAVVCALTADLWLHRRCREVGDPAEGQIIVPLPTNAKHDGASPAVGRPAETPAPYDTADGSEGTTDLVEIARQ